MISAEKAYRLTKFGACKSDFDSDKFLMAEMMVRADSAVRGAISNKEFAAELDTEGFPRHVVDAVLAELRKLGYVIGDSVFEPQHVQIGWAHLGY